MTTFNTQIVHIRGSGSEYKIQFASDNIAHFKAVQEVARRCVDQEAALDVHAPERVCSVYIDTDTIAKGRRCITRYLCTNCDCNLTDRTDVFYVHCPRCGYRIDYSMFDDLKIGKSPIGGAKC